MSRIDDLMKTLCPSGVEFKPLGLLGKRNKGTSITARKMKVIQKSSGPVRVFAGGQTVADVAEESIPSKDIIRVPSIIVKSRGHIGFTYYDKPFTHKAELWSYSISSSDVDQKFVYYYLLTRVDLLQETARATSVKLPQLGVKDTDNLGIPIPPIEVQREIVRILDTFTELEAELEARKRQYAYYRDSLLSFPETGGVRWVPMGELVSIASARTDAALLNQTNYVGVDNLVPGFGGRIDSMYLPNTGGAIRYEPGDILIGNIRPYLKKVWLADRNGGASPDVLTISLSNSARSVVLPRYLYHVIASDTFINYSMQHAKGAKMPRGDKGATLRYEIPTPPTEEQERIVSILDKFDALVNDLSIGLPAELAARRKQYAYYRDKLLTFDEAVV